MAELWLTYADENGKERRVLVDADEFYIGRHSESDLVIPLPAVSREHVKISRFGEIFVVDDCGSTLGTRLNGEMLTEPANLTNGDVLDLGGALEIKAEFASEQDESAGEKPEAAQASEARTAEAPAASGFPTSLFYLIPVFGVVILLCVGGGLFFALNQNGSSSPGEDRTSTRSSTDDSGPRKRAPRSSTPTPEPSDTGSGPSGQTVAPPPGQTQNPAGDVPPPPKTDTEADKVRTYSAAFLSRVVAKDPDAFLLDRQLQLVMPVVERLKGSSAVAANIAQARKDSAKIAAIATEKGLTAEFLTAAAVAKLGDSRGDVAATAQSMAGVLQKLQSVIGVESADEATVVVAAYYQGAAGSFQKMQATLEALTKNNTEGLSARQIRTVWFLNEKGKLTAEEFGLAVRFIAVGTIMQKPDDFGVKV